MFRLIILTSCTVTLFISGCSVQPWVLSQERGTLADPIMSFEQHAISARFMGHVHEGRGSARGAEGSAGGGCGCN